ncbi:hypothetical protein BDW27_12062 [Nocardiopsis sp. L17-MgMaSL7]|nr:hypothetical protein BDW27_12062 [Nocardiopsis sp. L17-MgMaSL7]
MWKSREIATLKSGGGGLAFYLGKPYSGEAHARTEDGGLKVWTFMEGSEDGPFTVWNASGKLILLGVRRHPYGKVGPWHEWDEEGRLLSETIYDALGNRIIHRELDENLNFVKQERFEPTTLQTDPETGRQSPAPWL